MSNHFHTSFDFSDRAAWDAFVASSPTGHLLQSWAWGELKARFGWQPRRIAVLRNSTIVAAAQMLLRPLPIGCVAYVPKGPLADPIDRAAWSMLIDAMHTIARQARAIFLKIEPDWPDEPASIQQLLDLGLRPGPSVQPKQTLVLDLTRSPDELLAAMKPKTRYNIGLASRKGVLVREGTPADLPTFHQLMQVTGRRDGFATHTREYYEAAWQLFAPSGHARLFLATCDDQVIAGLMAFAFGDKAWYLYGASSDEHRQRMPNHLLQWEAIRWAKAQGCRTYDLWGIPAEATGNEDDLTERRGGLWGVYRFKAGFGGRLVRYVGAFDFIYRPLLYKLYSRLAALR